jgi:hypothetical protein
VGASEGFGFSVEGLGDVNGDGFDDVAVSLPFDESFKGGGDADHAGRVYVILGEEDFFGSSDKETTSTDEIGKGLRGYVLLGDGESVSFGTSLGSADFNGDGFADILVGSYRWSSGGDLSVAGGVYVFWGGDGVERGRILLSKSLNDGRVLHLRGGSSGESAGWALESLGDVNRDGYDDIVIGAPGFDGGRGKVYVVMGKDSWGGDVDLRDVGRGVEGLQLEGEGASEEAGWFVDGGGDVNGDGFPDMIVGSRGEFETGGRDTWGRLYVIYGKNSFVSSDKLSSVGKSLPGYILYSDKSLDDVAGELIGDFNGDGFEDILLGTTSSVGGGESVYIVFGRSVFENSSEEREFSDIGKDDLPGLVLVSPGEESLSHMVISGGGDVNRDGFSEALLGVPFADFEGVEDGGLVHVVYGRLEGRGVREGSDGEDRIVLRGSKGVYAYGGDDVIEVLSGDFGSIHGGRGKDTLVYGGERLVFDDRIQDVEEIDLRSSDVRLELDGDRDHENFLELRILSDEGDHILLKNFEKVESDEDGVLRYVSRDRKLHLVIVSAGSFVDERSGILGLVRKTFPLDAGRLDDDGGQKFVGTELNMRSGYSLSYAGDIDGDGFDDMMVSAVYGSFFDRKRNGGVHVFYGRRGRDLPHREVGEADGVNSFVLWGANEGDRAGWSVGGGVDVNGDGFDDMVVGVPYFSEGERAGVGRVYVILGRSYEMRRSLDFGDLGESFEVVEIAGADVGDRTGWSVALSEDVNGDGLGDVIIGVPHADAGGHKNSGRVVVMYGSKNLGSLGKIGIDEIGKGVTGFAVGGSEKGGRMGWSVSSAGDVDGDGLADIAFGEPGGGRIGSSVLSDDNAFGGRVTVMRGLKDSFSSAYRVENFVSGSGWGYVMSGGGDVDGDGYDDVLVGSPRGSDNRGSVHVLRGGKGLLSKGLSLDVGGSGDWVVLEGEGVGSRFGYALTVLEDMNGDGISEILVGSPGYGDEEGGVRRGAGYLVLGRGDWDGVVKVGGSEEGVYRMLGSDEGEELGLSVSSAGDFDGDGVNDFVVGTHYGDPAGVNNAGIGYLVYGVRGWEER